MISWRGRPGRLIRVTEHAHAEHDDADHDADAAPGWDAVEAAVQSVTAVEPVHFAVGGLPDAGGVYAVDGYRTADGWLLVTLGLSELFEKTSDDPATSGWGLELTLRLPAALDEEQPPEWALRLLVRLGDHIDETGSVVGDGHRFDPGGPITGTPDTRLRALAFALDPELGGVDTPHGHLDFIRVVGITADELARMQATRTRQVLDELQRSPAVGSLMLTDPGR